MMTISYSITGRATKLDRLVDRTGEEIDVQAEVDRIISVVGVGRFLRITIETVDD